MAEGKLVKSTARELRTKPKAVRCQSSWRGKRLWQYLGEERITVSGYNQRDANFNNEDKFQERTY